MMIAKVTADRDISQKSILRRYMDLPKLLDLLHTRSLYFRRADGFSDRFEGALFPSLRKSLDEAFVQKLASDGADYFYRRAREGNYVSCWTIGATDNMALWQLYGGLKTSIAVTSTVDCLFECALFWNRSTHFHKVRYVDHRRVRNYVIGNYTDVLQYKSDAYKYEKELRVIVPQQEDGWEKNPIEVRLALPSVDTLVRGVIVAPEADSNFLEAVRELCKRYDLKAPVKRSRLSTYPK
ncbi:hypothetical protein ATY38_03740 [Nitrosomonas ureae]|nr:hypothetical protein ATY38_03740 [Nitrosomonas ureae]